MNFVSSRDGRAAMPALAAIVIALTGCSSKTPNATAASTAGTGVASGSSPSGPGICALLTMAEAVSAFPDVKVAKQDESRAEYGIRACRWESATGSMIFEVRVSKSSPDDEFGMLGMGVMGPNDTPPRPDKIGDVQVVIFDHKLSPTVRQDMGIAAVQKNTQTVDTIVNDIGTDHKELSERLAKLTSLAAARTP